MTIPALPGLLDDGELELASQCLVHIRASDQTLTTLGGLVPSFARAATATVTDAKGTSFTAAQNMVGWDVRDWDNDGIREEMGVLLGTSDRLSYAASWVPGTCAFYHEFIQVGAVPAANTGLWSLAPASPGGNALMAVDSDGTYWRFSHFNGSTLAQEVLAVAPANGDRVRMYGQLYSDGSVQVWQSINGATATNTARSGAAALAGSWGGGSALLRMSAVGAGNYGAQWLKRFKIVPGVPDYATLLRTM